MQHPWLKTKHHEKSAVGEIRTYIVRPDILLIDSGWRMMFGGKLRGRFDLNDNGYRARLWVSLNQTQLVTGMN